MTTAEAPWAEFDKKFRERFAVQDAGQQFKNLTDCGDGGLREMLAKVKAAQIELATINQLIADTSAKIDAAVAEHQRTTEPLQAELNDPAVSVPQKVKAREAVILANETLERTVTPLRKTLEAAEQQRDVVRATSSGTTAIENAFINCSPPAIADRIWTLRKAAELVDSVLFGFRPKVRAVEATVEATEAKRATMHAQHRAAGLKLPTGHYLDEELANETRLRDRTVAVAALLGGFVAECQRELATIRRERLAELHGE